MSVGRLPRKLRRFGRVNSMETGYGGLIYEITGALRDRVKSHVIRWVCDKRARAGCSG